MSVLDTILSFVASRGASPDPPLQKVRVWAAKCAAQIRAVSRAATAEARQKETAKLRELVEGGAADLVTLADSVSSSQREVAADAAAALQHASDVVLGKLETDKPDCTAEIAAFTAAEEQLRGMHRRMHAKGAFLQTAKVGVVVVPAIAAYLTGTYFRFDEGVYLLSDAVLRPAGAYDARDDGAYAMNAQFEKRFFEEFSRSYFGRKNTFASVFDASGAEMKLVFRNPKQADPLMVSTIEVAGQYQEEPFPWQRVDVTPKVRADAHATGVSFFDEGIGPALNLQYALQSEGWTLVSGKRDVLLDETAHISVRAGSDDVAAVRLWSSDEISPVFHVVSWNDGPAAGAEVIPCGGDVLEPITRLDRLAELTDVLRGGSTATLKYSYESLRRERYAGTATTKTAEDVVFYRRSPALRADNPCEGPPQTVSRPSDSEPTLTIARRALDKVSDKGAKPAGKDVIVQHVDLSLGDVRSGQRTTTIITPDAILSPGGFLLVYVRIAGIRNGSVDLALAVNGKPADRVTLPLRAPDHLAFDPATLEEELKRFAAK